MLSIGGSPTATCQGVSRREWLRAGGLTFLGLSLPDLLRGQAAAAAPGPNKPATFGKAKSCLIIYLSGGASHHDTFDMKPDAPAEIRGEFKPIATNVPGIHVCEHLPLTARHADKFMVVRSMNHRDNNHPSAVYWSLTGHEYPRATNLSEFLSRDDHPHMGSALTAVEGKKHRAVPTFVTLPDYIAVAGRSVPDSMRGSWAAGSIRWSARRPQQCRLHAPGPGAGAPRHVQPAPGAACLARHGEPAAATPGTHRGRPAARQRLRKSLRRAGVGQNPGSFRHPRRARENCASAIGATVLASRSSWVGGWSRRACAWSR